MTSPALAAVQQARQRIRGIAVRTPLIRCAGADTPFDLHLKLESLQPIGSFKLRGAANAITATDRDALAAGVYTASAGNMAQGVAWCARELTVPCTVIGPERAPDTKVAAVKRLGANVMKVPFDEWWQVIVDHHRDGVAGLFVHPFEDPAVMAGNGTIALEIIEDLPDVDVIVVPWGGGGLACGIAAAAREVNPGIRVYAVEPETAAPLAASFAAGKASSITATQSFVDGIGGKSVSPRMFELARELLAGTLTVSLPAVADAVRLLVERNHLVAEGAGAAAVAAAMAHDLRAKRVVAIVSGGNIDTSRLATILKGDVP